MKTAVMYGGGNIGRGFIGKVFADSGYEVCFLDIMQDIIDEMNARGQYTVRIVSNDGEKDTVVKPVRAVNSLTDQAIDEIVNCEIMATAVGVNVLPKIAPVIAKGVVARMERVDRPLDIILCENQLGADELMRGWIYERLTDEQKAWADKNLGLVEASIGRMVPPLTPEMRAQDKLLICVEPYSELPVDRDAFKGGIPDLAGLIPYSPFEFYIKRKLFLHNGGHALCAYLGYEKGYEYIWQAIADPEIYQAAKASMMASAQALVAKFGEGVRENVESNVTDLLFRFQNRALKDTVARVGADPVRKLRRNDRIVGAALFALEQGVDPSPIVKGILAALRFDRAEDATAPQIQQALGEKGIDYVLEHFMGLQPDEPLYGLVKAAYRGMDMGQLLKSGYLCNPQQAYTLRRFALQEGKARGVQVIEVATAGGLQVDFLPDNGLDIGQVRFKGVNMSWISKNGYDAPRADMPFENEFLRYFPGGLLYTGGLRSTGPANRDGDEWHPLHGRYHGQSAEQVCARVEGDEIVISGIVRETALFGHALELKREYRVPVFGAEIRLRDTLTNLAHQREEYALLYHCNFGWPLVSEDAHVELPQQRRTTPRTPFAATGLGQEHTFTKPVPGEEERVFFHEDMERRAAIVNPTLGARMTITWSDTLPILSHWRSMASGDYVCGLEPSNTYIMGREMEREHGTLPALEPFESVETSVHIRFE